ncbi:non-hydrolyzing UDP-N-acetylglucosamine 2-epimerase [Lactiplantibacillus pentosus]|jgi:UDP-N-acetylglucosamine 2-epimerase (non-hydrolysing)|uniref:UDP-N-acetylglucosamine 2-epimerase (non-hydrolyzing) n=1 Tax=Lactiplantibacillus pentosus TaxID=1589 RepID=A0AAW8VZV3_LACPE|nr:UDP-N-acetylglucosamine 2-epimerase (non-hydrolyzing) [Lactiplantibacillus pentosus]AUI79242.1 UDP-N-acetylglucosamine 2-epimerase [Lactiplantibacillus pentosus]AYG36885.1 UDP-N-acetylglucosamine 2-epimerase (non-hydrolyzing) [Lactiplantibacillus pentosus]AYG42514.1 UDP-N-acetylglucosamine 2-epimerase (non-hydrolyzing) [Lactiplantibacillus pentosus]MBO9166182.1 UDP-N-acetylglucosamine 2-epimerase (non-hydrolyzing) [Lactiplantibacillus pentosus]MBU7474998.1 UDP-N-acetylglucosamine 2-epimeras
MTKPIKVMTIFGTRPEAIKMAPIVLQLQQQAQFEPVTVVTAQHREMLDQVLTIFHITPDYDLNIMQPNQTLAGITSRVLTKLDAIMDTEQPDIVLVHGDTTTTFAASVSAFYHQIPVGHVEAGLRTWQKYSPYPEEMNRQLTDVLADMYFAPTELSRQNLLKEHHPDAAITVTGNTAIDALQQTVSADYQHAALDLIQPGHRMILLTMHRRENQGAPMEAVFTAIKRVVATHPDVEVVYPVHLSPAVQTVAKRILGNTARIHLIDPLDVLDFHNMAARSTFIMTDSGGVQEEAPSLNKPVLVLRDTTERPEGVQAGTLKLVGTDGEKVAAAMTQLLDDQAEYQRMADAANPYGDGHAAEYILQAITKKIGTH